MENTQEILDNISSMYNEYDELEKRMRTKLTEYCEVLNEKYKDRIGEKITTVKIASSVTKIGVNAFKDCDGIIGLALPDSIITLSKGAFESCEQLTDFKFGEKNETCYRSNKRNDLWCTEKF